MITDTQLAEAKAAQAKLEAARAQEPEPSVKREEAKAHDLTPASEIAAVLPLEFK